MENKRINPVFSRGLRVLVGEFRTGLGQNCVKKRGVASEVLRSWVKCKYLSTFAY